ncbi:MAG: response regulator [Alphaproteobacteria bacterium]|nr:response regulator [Alphaproteobacteria bacterium]
MLTWNAGARALLGYTSDEIIGRHFSRFYRTADGAIAAVKDALVHGRHEETGRQVRKDGTEVEIRSVLVPLYDAERRLTGFGSMVSVPGAAPITAPPENLEARMAKAPSATAPAAQGANEQVLLVDDNEDVRAVALRQLTSLGYRVIVASSGAEALDILRRGTEIDLLFTDVVMPDGIGGKELAEQAQKIRAGLKVLFASGYFEGALQRNGALEEATNFIVKPYKKADLARKIRVVLHGAEPPA